MKTVLCIPPSRMWVRMSSNFVADIMGPKSSKRQQAGRRQTKESKGMNFHKSHTFFSPPPATVFSGCGMQSKPSEAKQARVCLRVAVSDESPLRPKARARKVTSTSAHALVHTNHKIPNCVICPPTINCRYVPRNASLNVLSCLT